MADKTIKKTEPNESALLIAFAHAASKAQEIEGLLQDTVVGARQAGTPGGGGRDERWRKFVGSISRLESFSSKRLTKKFVAKV